MAHLKIIQSCVEITLYDFKLKGDPVKFQSRLLTNIVGIFFDQEAAKKLNDDTLVYYVQSWMPVPEGTTGGLFYGTSTIMTGKVGEEYFMTKGHFHLKPDRAEFYWGVRGEGVLIMMDRNRNTWGERIYPGSLHYINGEIAHRMANTGQEQLIVGACWPSDAGHDYEEIEHNGFSARLLEVNGQPVLVPVG